MLCSPNGLSSPARINTTQHFRLVSAVSALLNSPGTALRGDPVHSRQVLGALPFVLTSGTARGAAAGHRVPASAELQSCVNDACSDT